MQFLESGLLFDFKSNQEWIKDLALVSQLGLTMAGSIVFCLFVGLYIDRWLGTKGIFLILFIFLGILGGAVAVYRQIQEVLKKSEKKEPHSDDGKL